MMPALFPFLAVFIAGIGLAIPAAHQCVAGEGVGLGRAGGADLVCGRHAAAVRGVADLRSGQPVGVA